MLRKLIITAIVGNFVFMLVSVLVPVGGWIKYAAIADNETSKTYVTSTFVPEFLQLNAQLWKMKPDGSDIDWSAGNQMSFDIGNLTEKTGAGGLWGENSYAAIFVPATSGRKYKVTWTGMPFTGPNGAMIGAIGDNNTKLAEDAFLVIPDYQSQDLYIPDKPETEQGKCPGIVGAPDRVVTPGTVYTSDSGGLGRILRAYIGVTGNPDGTWTSYTKGHIGKDPDPKGTNKPYNPGTTWDVVTQNSPSGTYTSGSVTFTLELIPS